MTCFKLKGGKYFFCLYFAQTWKISHSVMAKNKTTTKWYVKVMLSDAYSHDLNNNKTC